MQQPHPPAPFSENLPGPERGTLDGLWAPEGRRALALALLVSAALGALFLCANAGALVEALALLRALLRG